MENILIENYRGFDIEFNTTYEKFVCVINGENSKESVSFSTMKKFIDEYKKTNQNFKPFWVDGRFVAEKTDGTKIQISDYDLKDYMLENPDNELFLTELDLHNKEVERRRLKDNEDRKTIIAKMKIVTLKEHKKSVI